MHPRHESNLMSMLERVCDHGSAVVNAWEIKRWFDKERITKTPFRSIDARFREVSGNTPLFIGDLGGSYVFIYAKGLTADQSAFFKPIEAWLATW